MSDGLYFIALLPPKDIQKEITGLQRIVKAKFGSQHALNAPPHITLHMPFKWKDKKIEQLNEVVKHLNESVEPFQIELKNFDFFQPRVVFIDVVENERLYSLQKQVVDTCRRELKLDNGNYKDKPFHPHVTVAFRDLKKPVFYEAKEYFQNEVADFKFDAESVNLLKHENNAWQIVL